MGKEVPAHKIQKGTWGNVPAGWMGRTSCGCVAGVDSKGGLWIDSVNCVEVMKDVRVWICVVSDEEGPKWTAPFLSHDRAVAYMEKYQKDGWKVEVFSPMLDAREVGDEKSVGGPRQTLGANQSSRRGTRPTHPLGPFQHLALQIMTSERLLNPMSPGNSPSETHHDHEIFIFVNTDCVGPFASAEVTGADIKNKAKLALDGELSKETPHGLVPVGNDERIHIHEDERFKYVPPTPGSG